MAAWLELPCGQPGITFDCEACKEEPIAKDIYGCTGIPDNGGGDWWFGPSGDEKRAVIYECPMKYLMGDIDIMELFKAGGIADWKMSVTEQSSVPSRYLDAWVLARKEINDIFDVKNKSIEAKHG